MTDPFTAYRGRCAYCEYETQTYNLLERAEADLLAHAYEEHTHISNPRVVHLSELGAGSDVASHQVP